MKKISLIPFLVGAIAIFTSTTNYVYAQQKKNVDDQLEVVLEMNMRPGNVAVNNKGLIFSTIHPFGNHSMQLIVVKDKTTYEAFPNQSWQRKDGQAPTEKTFDTPLGITTDINGNIWVIDMGVNFGKTRLFAFDAVTKENILTFTFPTTIAPPNSFVQDLVVDIKNGFVYLADIANPGLIVLNLNTKEAKRLQQHPSFLSEDVNTVIDSELIYFGGKPSRVAVDPISISEDKETIFYGAMNGKTWYSISAKAIRANKSDKEILATVKKIGKKPISDGATTSRNGDHYFTNLNDKGIDKWNTKTKKLQGLIRDNRLLWPDNVSIQGQYLYIAVNQLHKTVAFTGTTDLGKAPYYIYKFKIE
ncbi:cupin [Flavobacterium sp. F-328]|uniref:Cupin n=1 Tax=Flavobacterium erciyesense TaxID=2825842 RepID=A0ABS5D1R9_9FLAO|nr:L-dopachrome tautomerase-related protein [Flavobacterium erciyesense]MBQ0907968.1 cupin [Flavobacterium erciyesense]